MKDFWKFSFYFSCLKEYLPFMPIKPIMFLTVNILKKLPRINVYALDQVQLGIIPKNDMKFNFTVQMFERRTGKGDFKILQQIWQSAFRWYTTLKPPLSTFSQKSNLANKSKTFPWRCILSFNMTFFNLTFCFSMKYDLKTAIVNVFTEKKSGNQIKDNSLEVDFKLYYDIL